MHLRASGKVPEAARLKEATSPHPMADDRINHDCHCQAENDERMVLDAFGDSTRYDRGRRASENQLEEEFCGERYAGPTNRLVNALIIRARRRAIVGPTYHPDPDVPNIGVDLVWNAS